MAEKKPTKRTKRMTPAEWAEAKALWESGEFTLSQISDKVGASREHLSRKFKEEKIVKGSKSETVTAEAEESIKDEIAKNAKLLPQRVADTKDQHYKYAESLMKLGMRMVAQTMADGRPLSSISDDVKVLNNMSQLAGRTLDQRYKVLGLDQEDFVDATELPELPITVLTEIEMEEIRGRAAAQSTGVDDGLGGILDEEVDEIIEEGLEELEFDGGVDES